MMGALRYHYFHLYRQGVLLQDFDQQPYQDDCDDVPYCPHYPSRRVADGDDAVGDSGDGDDNMVDSKDTPNPSSMESPNHNTNSYSNSSRKDYSHSNHSSRNDMGYPNRSTSHK